MFSFANIFVCLDVDFVVCVSCCREARTKEAREKIVGPRARARRGTANVGHKTSLGEATTIRKGCVGYVRFGAHLSLFSVV